LKYKNLELQPPEKVENVTCDDVSQEEVDDILTYIIPQMKGICISTGGYGLAAPQVGIYKKFFILRSDIDSEEFDIYFNSRYFKDGSRIKSNEGCLTYDLGKKYNEVKRFKSIKIVYDTLDKDESLIKKVEKVKGMRAIGLQHESDHLYGITIFTK